jgi:hypothetical protein
LGAGAVMDVVFAAVLLLLAAAVVLLFAMMAELAARISTAGDGRRDLTLTPLEEARLGEAPGDWPEPLAAAAFTEDQTLLVVLSSACASCEDVAGQMSKELEAGEMPATAVLVSCGDRAIGEDFVHRHGLQRMPCYVDDGGAWVKEAFGVQTSPSALVIRRGRLESALVFTDLSALRAGIPRVMKEEAAA